MSLLFFPADTKPHAPQTHNTQTRLDPPFAKLDPPSDIARGNTAAGDTMQVNVVGSGAPQFLLVFSIFNF